MDIGLIELVVYFAIAAGVVHGVTTWWLNRRPAPRRGHAAAWIELHDLGEGRYRTEIGGDNADAVQTAQQMVSFMAGWQKAQEVQGQRREAPHVH